MYCVWCVYVILSQIQGHGVCGRPLYMGVWCLCVSDKQWCWMFVYPRNNGVGCLCIPVTSVWCLYTRVCDACVYPRFKRMWCQMQCCGICVYPWEKGLWCLCIPDTTVCGVFVYPINKGMWCLCASCIKEHGVSVSFILDCVISVLTSAPRLCQV